jgi:hypothetical protein
VIVIVTTAATTTTRVIIACGGKLLLCDGVCIRTLGGATSDHQVAREKGPRNRHEHARRLLYWRVRATLPLPQPNTDSGALALPGPSLSLRPRRRRQVLRSQSRLRLEGRTRALCGPSSDLSQPSTTRTGITCLPGLLRPSATVGCVEDSRAAPAAGQAPWQEPDVLPHESAS